MKQAILVRLDLKMPKGKLATQVAHASVDSVLKSSSDKIQNWKDAGMKKSVLKVNDLIELKKYQQIAQKNKIANSLIKDAGKTFFKKPTITCLGIGPDSDEKIDKITKELHLL